MHPTTHDERMLKRTDNRRRSRLPGMGWASIAGTCRPVRHANRAVETLVGRLERVCGNRYSRAGFDSAGHTRGKGSWKDGPVAVRGKVETWDEEEGWGVLVSPEVA